MKRKQFLQLAKEKEGVTLEFKQGFAGSISRDMVAFANTAGGTILLGVTDGGKLCGVNDVNRVLSQLQNLADDCSPSVPIRIRPLRANKKEFVAVEVPDGVNKPYSCSDGFFIRNGPSAQKLKRDEIIEFLNREGHVKFELRLNNHFDFNTDFDSVAFKKFLKVAGLGSKLGRNDLLQNLSLARMDRKKLRINNAGILFFAKEPEKFIRQNEVTCVLYKGDDKTYILERKDFKYGLAQNVEETMLFLKRNLANEYEIKGLKRKEIWDVPLTVLREAVLNAVMHRDYNETGASTLVEIYKDHVMISNPGGWPPGVDPKKFGKVSLRRNPVIADMFHRMNEVEKVGSGIRRMRELCQQNGNPEPKFEFEGGFFIAEFLKRKIKDQSAEKGSLTPQVPPKYPPSTPQVVAERKRLVSFCGEPRAMGQMLKFMKLKDRKSFRAAYLTPLLDGGLLVMTDPASPKNPKQKYSMTEKGRRWISEKV